MYSIHFLAMTQSTQCLYNISMTPTQKHIKYFLGICYRCLYNLVLMKQMYLDSHILQATVK